MEKVIVSKLEEKRTESQPVYHDSGEQILSAGETLEQSHLRAMEMAGIEEVFVLEGEREQEKLFRRIRFEEISVHRIAVGTRLDRPVFVTMNEMVLVPGETVTRRVRRELRERNAKQVLVPRPKEVQRARRMKFRRYARALDRIVSEEARETGSRNAPENETRSEKTPGEQIGSEDLDLVAHFYTTNGHTSPAKERLERGVLKQIDQNGIRFVTSADLEVGSELQLELRAPETRNLKARLKIISRARDHSEENRYEMVARFQQVARA